MEWTLTSLDYKRKVNFIQNLFANQNFYNEDIWQWIVVSVFLFVSLLLAKGNKIKGCQIFKGDIRQNLKFLDFLPTRLQSKMVGDSKLVGDLNWKLGTLNFKAFKIGGRVEGVLQARYPSLFIKICTIAIGYFQWKMRL